MKYIAVLLGAIFAVLAFQNCKPNTFDSTVNQDGAASESSFLSVYREDSPLVISPNQYFKQDQRFSYAPSVIKNDGDDLLHIYSCHNPANGAYDDEIYYTQISPQKSGNYRINTSMSFYPGNRPADWNACDPTIVQGNFQFKGASYDHAIFYTAMPAERFKAITSNPPPTNRSEYNEVRLILYSTARGQKTYYGSFFSFPRQSDDTMSYGFGQPSAINLDKNGKILLFYTHGRSKSSGSDWHTNYRVLDIANLDNPSIGAEKILTAKGVTPITNGDFTLSSNKKLFVITEDPSEWISGLKVASGLRLMSLDFDPANLDSSLQSGIWKIEKTINKNSSQQSLNHNAGFIRNGYGYLEDLGNVGVIYTGGDSQAKDIEWTYGLYAAYFSLGSTTQPSPPTLPPPPIVPPKNPPTPPPGNTPFEGPQIGFISGTTNPTFFWSAASGHDFYILDVSTKSNFPAGEFANCKISPSATSYSWSSCYGAPLFVPSNMKSTLSEGMTYYWRIVAFKGTDPKSSAISSFTVPGSGGTAPLVMSWAAYSGAQSYWVDVSTYSDFRWFWNCDTTTTNVSWQQCQEKKYAGVNSPPAMPATPVSGVKYYYRVVPVINGKLQGIHAGGSF